ncbi:hypothetical protein K7432_008012 [Basidiobolus ranarum]|uniref:Uncharacterized protein n=1 Tax=Basidiobolus ranarum TaxID=34480 RepID=A0ABR2VZ86_9FUNG
MNWLIRYFLLAIIAVSVVLGQTTSVTTSSSAAASATPESQVESCIKQQNCAPADVACRAKCAQVPNPDATMVNNTNNCVAQCDQTNATAYAQCKSNCINTYYGPNPSNSTSSNGNNGSTTGSGGGNSTSTNGNGGSNKTSSASNLIASIIVSGCILGTTIAIL